MLLLERCCSTIGSKNGAIETISLQLISSLPLKSVQVFAHKCATKKLPKWFLQWWQLLKQDRTVDAFWCVFSTIIKRTRKTATQTVTTRFDSIRRVMMRFDAFWWKLIVYVEMMVNADEMTNSKVKIIWGCNNGSWSLKDDFNKRRWVARSNCDAGQCGQNSFKVAL